jgi:hypothetical protein
MSEEEIEKMDKLAVQLANEVQELIAKRLKQWILNGELERCLVEDFLDLVFDLLNEDWTPILQKVM